jgi:hypothetical protein
MCEDTATLKNAACQGKIIQQIISGSMIKRDKNPSDSFGITLGVFPIRDVIRMTLMQTINQYALTQLAQKNAKGFVTTN